MNTTNLDFRSAAHCEVFVNQFAADLQTSMNEYTDSQLRSMIVWRICQPYRESQYVALTMLRELQRRLEVRELEGEA